MPMFTFVLPAATDPARVDAWLVGHGYVLEDGSSLHSDGIVSVMTDRDPSAEFALFANQPTLGEQGIAQAVTALKAYVAAVQAIPAATRTPEMKALLAITAILKAQLTP